METDVEKVDFWHIIRLLGWFPLTSLVHLQALSNPPAPSLLASKSFSPFISAELKVFTDYFSGN